MTADHTVELTGLTATNPMGFLAALGVLNILDRHSPGTTMLWTDGVAPHPLVPDDFSIERIAEIVVDEIPQWQKSVSLTFKGEVEVKFEPEDIHKYLDTARKSGIPGDIDLASALVAEMALDNNGKAKPTDLHFLAGNQRFLSIALEIANGTGADEINIALTGPWPYDNQAIKTLSWDPVDDRVYALSATDPSKEKKATNPGVDWLALMGVASFPVVRHSGRTVCAGMSGSWKSGTFQWAAWNRPMTALAARSLQTQVTSNGKVSDKYKRTLSCWGVHLLMSAHIRRTEQGGYGSFSPSSVVLQT